MPKRQSAKNTNDGGNTSALSSLEEKKNLKSLLIKNKKKLIYFIVVVLIVIAGVAFLFKSSFLVALIDGRPIFRYELNKQLVSSFGKDTLENLIVERLIRTEIAKQKITVGEEEVQNEISKLTKSLGEGVKIEDALKLQGISLKDFQNQLKLRLQVNKLLQKDVSVSDDEVLQFITSNSSTLVATTEAEKKVEAKQILMEQKVSQKIQEWINTLLKNAKITRFLN